MSIALAGLPAISNTEGIYAPSSAVADAAHQRSAVIMALRFVVWSGLG